MSNLSSYKNTINEGGEGFNPHEAKAVADAIAKADARIDEIAADLDGYRARWNAAVVKYTVGGKVAAADMKKIEAAAGCTLNEIKLAKARA